MLWFDWLDSRLESDERIE
jgi:hypothetical protein